MSSGPGPVLTPTIPGDSPSLRDQGKQLEKGPLGKCHTLTGSWKGRRRTQSGARTQRTVIAGPQGSSCPVRRPLNAGGGVGGLAVAGRSQEGPRARFQPEPHSPSSSPTECPIFSMPMLRQGYLANFSGGRPRRWPQAPEPAEQPGTALTESPTHEDGGQVAVRTGLNEVTHQPRTRKM